MNESFTYKPQRTSTKTCLCFELSEKKRKKPSAVARPEKGRRCSLQTIHQSVYFWITDSYASQTVKLRCKTITIINNSMCAVTSRFVLSSFCLLQPSK